MRHCVSLSRALCREPNCSTFRHSSRSRPLDDGESIVALFENPRQDAPADNDGQQPDKLFSHLGDVFAGAKKVSRVEISVRSRPGLCVNPEFSCEGSAIVDCEQPSLTLLGVGRFNGSDARLALVRNRLFNRLFAPVTLAEDTFGS